MSARTLLLHFPLEYNATIMWSLTITTGVFELFIEHL